MALSEQFWQQKSLLEMSDEEWEALCDGCGKRQRLYFTRIACDLLDLETGRCQNYSQRFKLMPDCTKLTKKNLPDFTWLPKTCAYRLLYEGKPLPDWHPLLVGDQSEMHKAK